MPHKTKEKFKTEHNVFDNFTNRTLFKLISEGHFVGLESPIAMGKEANIFSAVKEDGKRVMVKIYRLEACDFNKMYDYIKSDERYVNIRGKKRIIIFHWVQREFRNLIKARRAKVNVPEAITFKNNILVLEFIGKEGVIAPRVSVQKPKEPKKFFDKIVRNIRNMYKAKLVHADLSAFNILNNDEEPVFIDFSQTTTLRDSRANEYLERDVKNICTFFKKLGLRLDEGKIMETIVSKRLKKGSFSKSYKNQRFLNFENCFAIRERQK
ncbi:MAG: serine protein kinase RIO [Nanoarchaeota archaeon]|nr:serine protein kinase RIO [Nanoarchaeota archaeon]